MELKLSRKKITKRITSIFTSLIIFAILWTILFIVYSGFDKLWPVVIFAFIMGVLPDILLLIEYFSYTKKINSVVFSSEEFTVFYKDDQGVHYRYGDIKTINLYKAAGMDKGNYSYKSNEKYYFANIIAKDGKSIILTSLLDPDLNEGLDMMKDVPVYRTKTGYAFVFWYVDR